MATTAPKIYNSIEDLTLRVEKEIHVKATLEETFEALLEKLGPFNGPSGDGSPMPMKLEAWPGGRWYRDLGNNNGHCWGHVQAIKKPTLLEIYGPLFMSFPVSSNVQYRLSAADGGTLIKFHHLAFGFVTEDIRNGVSQGWGTILDGVRKIAEDRKKH
jgi:uncharacterized protein YndB with AHSA1/START domain